MAMACRFALLSRSSVLLPPPLASTLSPPPPSAAAAATARRKGGRNGLMVCGRSRSGYLLACQAARKHKGVVEEEERWQAGGDGGRSLLQAALWAAEAAYILWLFLLPFAPGDLVWAIKSAIINKLGDPVWAIKSTTINDLVGLSLNFFFILPLMNAVGIHALEAPVLHPVAEGLFNFVIGWTLLFAPLLYTDCLRDRYKGSLDLLWGFQMFLTNTFLIPYMAIRLNDADEKKPSSYRKLSQLGSAMAEGSSVVGVIGGVVCLVSLLWALSGRPGAAFGGIADRWEFFQSYIGSERLAYAFIWDICLYTIFQPWLIGGNLQNVNRSKLSTVSNLRFIPVVGLVAYTLCLERDQKNIKQP